MTVEQFGKALNASGLMTADDVKSFWNGIPADARPKTDADFGKLLVDKSLLTPFQVAEIIAGRGARLVMGDYTIAAQIGAGGMGQVYKANHRRMKRTVALKVMSSAAMQDEAAVKRFQREVHAAAKLEHPNIVTAYDSGESGNVKYLVMQFVDGGDLSDLVKKGGRLPIEQAVGYVIQAARGLAFAHGEGVIHRDIKPANLLLDKKGVVKILDMGLARFEDGGDGLTATEQVMGTVDYMSPEQAANTKGCDGRADIYSLGCTLWFLLTGKKLYEADTLIARLMLHRDGPLPSLVKERDDAPWPLEQALHKMIAKRVQDRFQSMDEAIAALAPYGGNSAGSSGGGSSPSISQNADLASFMQAMGTGGGTRTNISATQVKPATSANVDATAQFTSPEVGTDPKSQILPKSATTPKPQSTKMKTKSGGNKTKLIAAGAIGALLLLAGIIVKIRDKDGNVVAEVNAPTGTSAEVITNSKPTATDFTPLAPKSDATPSFVATSQIPAKLATFSGPRWPYDPPDGRDYVWGEPENLGATINSEKGDLTPAVSGDGLRLIYERNGKVYEARRSAIEQPFGDLKPLDEIFAKGDLDRPRGLYVSPDGLYLSSRPKSSSASDDYHLYVARRSDRNAPWGAAVRVEGIADNSYRMAITADRQTAYFDSLRREISGGRRIFATVRKSPAATFEAPTLVELDYALLGSAEYPHLMPDDRTLVLRRGWSNETGERFAWARRDDSGKWTTQLFERLGSDPTDQKPSLTADGRTMFYESRRSGGSGDSDIWVTRRVPKSGASSQPSFTASAATPAAVRWPLAPSKPEDIRWALELQAKVTLRSESFGGTAAERVISKPEEIPSGSATIVGVEIHPIDRQTTDADLERIATLVDLETFVFGNQKGAISATSAGLRKLAALANLRRLDVHHCKNYAAGASEILKAMPRLVYLYPPHSTAAAEEWIGVAATLPSIRELYLFRCDVTDAGFAPLAKMPQLAVLDVRDNSKLTQPAIERFAAAVPGCRITWGTTNERKVMEPRTPPTASNTAPAPAAVRWPLAATRPEEIAWLRSLNARVVLRNGTAGDRPVPSADPFPPGSWTVVGIELHRDSGPEIDDKALGRIAALTDLEMLRGDFPVSSTKVTREGFQQFKSLVNLRELQLGRFCPSDSDPGVLAAFPQLEILKLMNKPLEGWERHVPQTVSDLSLYNTDDAKLEKLGVRPQIRHLQFRGYYNGHPQRLAAAKPFIAANPWCRVTFVGLDGSNDKQLIVEPTAPPPIAITTGDDATERRVALWLFDLGMKIRIYVDGISVELKPGDALPRGSFHLERTTSQGKEQGNIDDAPLRLADLRRLPKFTGGYFFRIGSDAWAEAFSGIPEVTLVNAFGSDLTRVGLAHLARLPKLDYINLDNCRAVDAAGLAALAKSSSLRTLRLDKNHFASGGYDLADVQKLQDALPNCEIKFAGNDSAIPGLVMPKSSATEAGKLFMHDPAFAQWLQETKSKAAPEQLAAVSKKLMELHPGFDGKLLDSKRKQAPIVEAGMVTKLSVQGSAITDLSPLKALTGLKELSLRGPSGGAGRITDLSPLEGLPLVLLDLFQGGGHVTDLSPLRGMQLEYLACRDLRGLADITPLAGMPLKHLDLYATKVVNLTPVKGMPLETLVLAKEVSDISALRGLPLTHLECHSISDLAPLKGMPLNALCCDVAKISDYTPLYEFTGLTTLRVFSVKDSAAVKAALQKALPNCKLEVK